MGAGIGLIILSCAIVLLSKHFEYTIPLIAKPIPLFVVLQVCAGIVYLLCVKLLKESFDMKGLLVWVLFVGIALRVSMFVSTPILEDDYYRYLWDGAVVTTGLNPYQFAPEQVLAGDVPVELQQLASESSPVIERINHPHVRTIYPLVAQGFFAVSHWLGPWSTFAWRFILLVGDCVTLILLILILKAVNLPLLWLVVYWWNPLVIKETFNSGHLDVLALPFVLATLLLMIHKRYLLAIVMLALATATKLWPIVLLPLVVRPLFEKPKRLTQTLLLFVLLITACFIPVFTAKLNSSSGFVAYSQTWENNSFAFRGILWAVRFLFENINIHQGHAQIAARIVAVCLLILWIAYMIRRPIKNSHDVFERSLLVVAATFMLSPTQFPWYYVWLVPFLVVRSRLSLALFTILLPLYYVRYYLGAHARVDLFNRFVILVEHLPVWLLLAWEWLKNKSPQGLVEVGAR